MPISGHKRNRTYFLQSNVKGFRSCRKALSDNRPVIIRFRHEDPWAENNGFLPRADVCRCLDVRWIIPEINAPLLEIKRSGMTIVFWISLDLWAPGVPWVPGSPPVTDGFITNSRGRPSAGCNDDP